jgi:outer membrane protein assembly factor BamB
MRVILMLLATCPLVPTAVMAQAFPKSDLPIAGMVVVLGDDSGQTTLALADQPGLVVQSLCTDAQPVEEVRRAIGDRGVYGRVSAVLQPDGGLPYADNLVNAIILADSGVLSRSERLPDEIQRVLAPLGSVYIRGRLESARQQALAGVGLRLVEQPADDWLKATKPWPADIDEWSHHLHAADGNPVANDHRVGPPTRYQWIGDPVWAQSHESDSNLRCLVTARGRLYYIVNEAPTSLAGPQSPPDKWFLTGRDAFNGIVLWKIPVPQWGWREWKPSWFTPRPGVIPLNLDKRVVAAGDDVFATLGYRAAVSRIDGRTGEILQTYEGTDNASEILYLEGQLYLTVLQGDRAVVKRVDADSGKTMWTSEKDYGGTITDYYRFSAMHGRVPEAKVAPTLDIATDGKVVGLLDGDSVVCLDGLDGTQRWRTKFPLADQDHNAGRIQARQKVWTGTMIVADGILLHASPNQLAAFSAETGEVAWLQPKKYLQHLWYEWKDVFVIDGLVWTWSSTLARERLEGGGNSAWPVSLNGYDLHSGKLAREVPLGKIFKTHHHHRCYRNKATVNYVLASRRGTEFVDLVDGQHSVNNWVRGTCHMGMVPANGLQYAPPHPCQCYNDEKLKAMNALAAGRADSPTAAGQGGTMPRREPAMTATDAAAEIGRPHRPADWPTYRGDQARSGRVRTRLSDDLKQRWTTQVGGRLSPPICVGGVAYTAAVDQHQVVAIDVQNGRPLWRFVAGARIDSPPTFDRGALLFGSADGYVYRVDAATGQLIWRFRAAPEQRQIAAFGRFESAWPVHGSVLVDAGPSALSAQPVAYCCAGRSSHLDGGLWMYALDAHSGRLLESKNIVGPTYTVDNVEQNYLLPMGMLPGIMMKEGDTLFMRGKPFDEKLTATRGKANLQIRGGFLDDAYFKRMPWSMKQSGHARLIVYDDQHAYGLRMFDSLRGLDPNVYFTPGQQGYLLFAHARDRRGPGWKQRIPIRGRAMAVTTEQLSVAGPPDVVDPDDPLAAFEGRKGGVLRTVDKASGRTNQEFRLAAPPVFNGIAAANGQLLLTLEDGSVVCFGNDQ